jgi:hypothetical protein
VLQGYCDILHMPKSTHKIKKQKKYSGSHITKHGPTLSTLKKHGYTGGYCTYKPIYINNISNLNNEKDNIEDIADIADTAKNTECTTDLEEGRYVYAKYNSVTRVFIIDINGFLTQCKKASPIENFNLYIALLRKTEADIIYVHNIIPIQSHIDSIEPIANQSKLQAMTFKHVIDIMYKSGWKYHYLAKHPVTQNLSKVSTCFKLFADAIFSRYPLTETKTEYLPSGASVILFATTVIDDVKTLLVNVHILDSHTTHAEINGAIQREMSARNIHSVVCNGNYRVKYDKLPNNEWTIVNTQQLISNLINEPAVFIDIIPTVKLSSQNAQLAIKKIKFEQTINIQEYSHVLINTSRADKFNNVTHTISDNLIELHSFKYPNWWASDNIKLPITGTSLYDYHTTTLQMEVEFGYINAKRMQGLTKLSKRLSGAPINLTKELAAIPTGEPRDNLEMDIDEIMLYYLKTRKDLRTIVIWPACGWDRDKDRLRNTFQLLNANGRIFYTKRFMLNYNEACALMFALYATTHINKDYWDIEKTTTLKGWNSRRPDDKRPILVFFYEYTSGPQAHIAGTDKYGMAAPAPSFRFGSGVDKSVPHGNQAYFKMQIRGIWKHDKIRQYDILHISDFFSEALDNCHMFLNRNSMRILSSQNISKFLKLVNVKIYTIINLYKSVVYNKFGLLEANRFCATGSILLFIYGIRRPNDIDYNLLGNVNESTNEFQQQFNKFLMPEGNSFVPFVDVFPEKLIQTYKKIALLFGASDYNEVILNPRYHQYFLGIKMSILPIDIVKRIMRFRPKALSDIIRTGQLLKYKLKFPNFPDGEFAELNPGYIKKTIKYYMKKEYKIDLSSEEIDNYFTNYNYTWDKFTIDLPRDRYILFKVCGALMNYYDDFKHIIPKSAADAGL